MFLARPRQPSGSNWNQWIPKPRIGTPFGTSEFAFWFADNSAYDRKFAEILTVQEDQGHIELTASRKQAFAGRDGDRQCPGSTGCIIDKVGAELRSELAPADSMLSFAPIRWRTRLTDKET